MRRSYSLVLIYFTFSAVFLSAHGTSFAAKPGQFDFSVYSGSPGGMDLCVKLETNSNRDIVGYSFDELTVKNNAGATGLISMAEYTVAPGLALGLIVNVPQLFFIKLSGGNYNFDAAVTADWKWLRNDRWTLGSRLELEVAPLLGAINGSDEGFYNIFATPLSFSYELLRRGDFALDFYGDTKAVTSILNPAYRSYADDLAHFLICDDQNTLTGLPHTFGPGCRLVFAPGFEVQYKKFYAFLGYNFLLARLASDGHIVGHFPDEQGFEKIEFSWRWRF